jgi:transcriptional regulator with XRE-family HTH domain
MKGLGKRIRSLRKAKRLTIVEIAKSTGIDKATLSRIENGHMTGTLDSHRRIADALSIRLPDLYQNVLEDLSESKEKKARQKIETFSHSSGAVAELLTTGILQKKMMPVLLKIKPKGRTEAEEYPSPTERFVYIIKGNAEAVVGKETRRLRQGESLYFDAALSHRFANKLQSECWILSVMTPTSL